MNPAHHVVAAAIADAALASDGEWTPAAVRERLTAVIGRRRWLAGLVERVLSAFPEPPHTARSALVDLICAHPAFVVAMRRRRARPSPMFPFLGPYASNAWRWGVPALAASGDIAEWLDLSVSDLGWLADRKDLLSRRREGPLHHYVCTWHPKPHGGARLIEAPKPRLRAVQRRILREILDRVPPHEAVHGFRVGRSAITHAAQHTGATVVIRLDLRSFFTTTRSGRIRAVFSGLGYPEGASKLLTALCVTVTPRYARLQAPASAHREATAAATPHLPQGAPTSPALANLAAWSLDVRLAGAAAAFGATYSRYADDLAFSGGAQLADQRHRFVRLVTRIASDEGYAVNEAKTRIRTGSTRQELVGIVVNAHPNVRRDDYDLLKATLYNCVRYGPASQNRDGDPEWRRHLEGRVGWVRQVAPSRAVRLDALLAQIAW